MVVICEGECFVVMRGVHCWRGGVGVWDHVKKRRWFEIKFLFKLFEFKKRRRGTYLEIRKGTECSKCPCLYLLVLLGRFRPSLTIPFMTKIRVRMPNFFHTLRKFKKKDGSHLDPSDLIIKKLNGLDLMMVTKLRSNRGLSFGIVLGIWQVYQMSK